MPTPDLPSEFLTLAEKYLSGELTPDERAKFENHLRLTPGAAEYCVTLGFTEALIPDAGENLADTATKERADGNIIRFTPRGLATIAALVAGGVALGFAVSGRLPAGSQRVATSEGGVPARITQAMGVKWSAGRTDVGSRLASASGAFESGLLELTLDSGVRILLEGPAEYAVTGRNACRLVRGKAVVDVPVPAQGFVMDSAKERIVDHGTRFAVNMGADGRIGTLGVLSGIVDIEKKSGTLRLFTDYAVERHEDEFDSVAFRKESFYREMPTREFPWEIPENAGDRTLAFDVTPLIHGPGDYRLVVKWLTGKGAFDLKRLTLRRDDLEVSAKTLTGLVGGHEVERDNFTLMHIADADWTGSGRWTVSVETSARSDRTPKLSGVLHFAEGPAVTATGKDFIGVWRYTHNGVDYRREIYADGTMLLVQNGKPADVTRGSTWKVVDGILAIRFTEGVTEYHMLQEDGSLVFLNRNYRNAHKMPGK